MYVHTRFVVCTQSIDRRIMIWHASVLQSPPRPAYSVSWPGDSPFPHFANSCTPSHIHGGPKNRHTFFRTP